jgi:hypothetical protein
LKAYPKSPKKIVEFGPSQMVVVYYWVYHRAFDGKIMGKSSINGGL